MFVNMYETKLWSLGIELRRIKDQYDHIINIDAADTLFLRHIKELDINYLKGMMLFAGERNQFPFKQLDDLYSEEEKREEYPYLNGGGFMGEMPAVIRAFDHMEARRMFSSGTLIANEFTDYFRDDQGAWAYEYVHGYPIVIDNTAQVFQTLCLVDQEKNLCIENGELFNMITGTQPFILHANGSSDYQNIYEQIIKR